MGLTDFFSSSIKKNICKNLIQNYLDDFLKKRLTADQLTVDISSGVAEIHDVEIKVEAVNQKLEKAGFPFVLVEGYVEKIEINIPWKTLLAQDTVVKVIGLQASLRCHTSSGADTDGSEWLNSSQMSTTSMHLAEECMKDDTASNSLPDGLEGFAKTIESVLSRVRVILLNTEIRVESCLQDPTQGIAVEVRIERVDYFDDSSRDMGPPVDNNEKGQSDSTPLPFIKHVHISGDVSLYTDIFLPCHNSSTVHSMAEASSPGTSSDIFASAISSHSPILHQPSYVSSSKAFTSLPKEQNKLQSNPIMFLKAAGEHRLRVHTLDKDSGGPQTSLSLTLGSIGIYILPEQIKLLSQLVKDFTGAAGDLPEHSGGKNMDEGDYDQLETALQHQMFMSSPDSRLPTSTVLELESLQLAQHLVYDTASLVDSDMFESVKDDLSMSRTETSTIYTSTGATSTYQYGSESAYTGSTMRRRNSPPEFGAKPAKVKLDCSKKQITLSNLHVGVLVAVVLNENPTSASVDPLDVDSMSGIDKHKEKAERFLAEFFTHSSRCVLELLELREDVSRYCYDSHIKLISKMIEVKVKQTSPISSKKKKSSLTADVTISQLEVTEWLVPDNKIRHTLIAQQSLCEILTFPEEETASYPSSQPCMKLQYSTESSSSRFEGVTKEVAKVIVELGRECLLEVDISLTDRLKDLIQVFSDPEDELYGGMSAASSPITEIDNPETVLTFCVRSELDVTALLRFPIADLRKDASQQFSWWRRNLRQEILELKLSKPRFHTRTSKPTEMEFQCRSLQAFFLNAEEQSRIAFANIGQELGDKDGLEWPRLVIKVYPPHINSLLEEDESVNSTGSSLEGACADIKKPEASPFSGVKAMLNDNEELRMPGSKKEMEDFEFETKNNTQMYIQLDLPAVNIVMPSKRVLELLYNRVCNDLLLWESLVPIPNLSTHQMFPAPTAHSLFGAESYMGYKSALYTNSTEDDEDELDDYAEETRYSIHSRKRSPRASKQSKSCVSINIKRGCLTLIHPVNGANDSVVADCYGQSTLDISDGVIYVNSKSMGDPNLNYISIHSGQCSLYHNGCIPGSYKHPAHVERLSSGIPAHLPLVLELCPLTVPSKLNYSVGSKGDENMLSIAIKVTLDPEPKKQVKYIDIAIALKRACLHHQMVDSSHMWIKQLMGFLALDDYDVLGYPFPKVFTELHFHVLSSAISYIPKNLALGGLLTLEKFSITSNVIVDSPVSLLAFSVEDAAFYLSDKESRCLLKLNEDYVCLIQLNCFHLAWKSSDGKNPKYPKCDICVNCSTLHVKTCADSCLALQKYIVYIAGDGDLSPQEAEPTADDTISLDFDAASKPPVQKTEEVDISDIMEDAMEDIASASVYPSAQEKPRYPADMFTYPSSKEKPVTSAGGDAITPTSSQAASQDYVSFEDDSSDDDFCIVDYPDVPKEDTPVIVELDSDPITAQENFFSTPSAPVNLLTPPQGFPEAVSRYCLANLTVVWNLHGGRDFGTAVGSRSEKGTATSKGGVARCYKNVIELQLSKVQAHWEVYPDNTRQVSRRCLLVDNIEVRDLVLESDINKLLYQYSSSAAPRQKHTSMVSVKLVTNRPDQLQPDVRHESDVRVSLQPIRVNLHQVTLKFLQTFISDLKGVSDNGSATTTTNFPSSPVDDPVMTTSIYGEEGRAMFDEMGDDDASETKPASTADSPLFIKNFVFTPDVAIKLDYVGHHIDVEQQLTGIALGLAQFNNLQLRLKSLHLKKGTLGIEKLVNICVKEWMDDIIKSQVPLIIGAVGPFSAFIQFYQGLHDLVWLPIEQYRKDGRIVRGLQKGANAFTSSTAVAMVELSNRLMKGFQGVGEFVFELVSPGTIQRSTSRRSQPRDIRAGLNQAIAIGNRDLTTMVTRAYHMTAEEGKAKGLPGAVGGAIRQVPALAITPLLATTNMAAEVLTGMRNQLDPDAHKEDAMKYKTK